MVVIQIIGFNARKLKLRLKNVDWLSSAINTHRKCFASVDSSIQLHENPIMGHVTLRIDIS